MKRNNFKKNSIFDIPILNIDLKSYPKRQDENELIVVSLNVHNFVDKKNRSNVERIIQLLKPLKIDILNIQEVGFFLKIIKFCLNCVCFLK